MTDILGNGVHLVGSVPLQSADEVFATIGPALGERLRSMPDGETGDRSGWILKQIPTVERQPWSRRVEAELPFPEPLFHYQLADDYAGGELTLPPLGYADAAVESYELFTRYKKDLKLPSDLRFQVSIPTPHGFMIIFEPDTWTRLIPVYEEMLRSELAALEAAVPHGELTIQWDMAAEPGILEGLFPADVGEMYGTVTRLVDAVPDDIPVGIHLCYGSLGNVHYMQPKDTGVAVAIANRVSADTARPVDFVHLPVPRDRADEAYFAPLRDLKLDNGTRLHLGLVHDDGVERTRNRMRTAAGIVDDFGIATECGFGRADPATLPVLLDVHRALAAPISNR